MIEETYGSFPGGGYDPRRFRPDRDVNTAEEIEAWERLCAAWEAGCSSVVFAPGLHFHGDGVAFLDGSPLGMGTYEIDLDPDPGVEEPIPVEAAA